MKADSSRGARDDKNALTDIIARVQQISAENEALVRSLAEGETRFRKLAKAVWRVQEEERRNMALELHDGIGQILTALINHLQRSGSSDGGTDPEATELAATALQEARRLSRALRPSVLDDLGLEAALRWLMRTTGEAAGLEISLQWPEQELSLDKESETLVFRIVQEALTNTVKHASASRAKIGVGQTKGWIQVTVTDNGQGFDAAKTLAASDRGFGTRGMRDRAELFGGRLTIDSAPNEGTAVTLLLPESNT